jgi:hypothetical protein
MESFSRCFVMQRLPWALVQADGRIDRIFAGSVRKLHQDGLLELMVIHGDHDHCREEGRRQPGVQRTQAPERRQGGRLLRSPLQRDRAIRFCPGQPQRIAASA